MTALAAVLQQLDQERTRVRAQLDGVNEALRALRGEHTGVRRRGRPTGAARGGRRRMSPAAIARIRAGQKKRWAKWKKEHKKS